MSSPFFTVICPLYNAEQYLDESIQSVLNQSFTNWVMILVDDGSKDDSFDKAKQWAEKDERIKVLQHPGGVNKGVSASRNLGLEHAKASWVAFLDADDVWLPEKLQKQREAIRQYEEKNLVFIYCPAKVIDGTGKLITDRNQTKDHNPMFGTYGAGRSGFQENAFRWAINKGFEAPTSSVVCRKDIILQLRGFEEDMSYSEDGLMWYRMIEKGNMFYINIPLLHYRVHTSQWNAGVTNQLKLARRFVGYSRLLEKVSGEYKNYISFLLVYKGFRIIVRNNLGYPYLDFKIILSHGKKLISHKKVSRLHKLYAPLVFISELVLAPFRWLKLTFRKR